MSRENQLQLIENERIAIEETVAIEIATVEPITASPYAVLSEEINPINFPKGLSGSLTQLVDGSSFLIEGANIEITSASNGHIILAAPEIGISVPGVDGDVQFNDGGTNFGADPTFTFDKSTRTLNVPYLSSSLTRLSSNSSYLLPQGLVTISSGSSITISRLLSDDISYETWKSYTPNITATIESPTLPSDIIAVGKYMYSYGVMKMIFNASSRVTTGALPGQGTYLISMPDGYEIDIDAIPVTTPSTPLDGISLGIANISMDSVGGGGAWSIVPVSTSQLMLVGKSPADTAVSTWGSSKFPFGSGNDYRVSFSVTIPAKIAPSFDGTLFVEGALTINPGTIVNLYASVFNRPGSYVLFDYSSQGASFNGNQSTLDSNITINFVDLPDSISTTIPCSLIDDAARKRIVLTIWSNPTNGKIFVEGDLTFTGLTTMSLSSMLYGTPGTYELFETTGNISGIEYLRCRSESGFVCGLPFQDGTLIKVTLT